MFVFLSKFLPIFVYPVGLSFVLLVAAIVFSKKNTLRNGLIIAALALIFISGNRWVSMSLARSLEWRYLPPVEVPEVQVAVVLGGGTEGMQYPRSMAEVNSAGDRLLYAARLYQQRKVETLLLSGGNIAWYGENSSSPAEDMQELLLLTSVPESAMWLEMQSQNTSENAQYSADILREENVNTVLLITSAMHMPRAVKLFEAQGLTVIPAPTDYTVTQAGWQNLWHGSFEQFVINLFPTSGNIALTTNVLKEYIGMAVASLQSGQK